MTPAAEQEETRRTSDTSVAAERVLVDPRERADWDSLLAPHQEATIFHTSGWAAVLCQTYGHNPAWLCRFEGRQMAELLPVMEVASPLTGRRGVSLPFTDYCPALKPRNQDGRALFEAAMDLGRQRGWKYLECRNPAEEWPGATPSLSFYGHVIDLTGGDDTIFKRFEGSIRQGVRKAEAAGLSTEFNGSPDAIRTYYALHCLTRRGHGLPPQPFRFFENIQRHVLDKGRGFVTTVRLKEKPLAAGVFFIHGRRAVYKYGASDYSFQHLRPNNLMMWESFKHCARLGGLNVHLGRTSLHHEGLRRFKKGLGAVEETVRYYKYDFASERFVNDKDRVEGWFNQVFSRLPLPLLRLAGRILYPHLS